MIDKTPSLFYQAEPMYLAILHFIPVPYFTYKYSLPVRQKDKGAGPLPGPEINEFAETGFSGYTGSALQYDCSTPAAVIRPQQPLCDTNPDRRCLLVLYCPTRRSAPRCTRPEVGLSQPQCMHNSRTG
ncbi:MAG: hypothetical protein HKP44_16310 [Desulfofustis sp.]|nr:hypothetical protein [Desulfofustis sp.]